MATIPPLDNVVHHAPSETRRALTLTTNEGLLRTMNALTHQMHGRRRGDTALADLRHQRDLVQAEILRRMAATDAAYQAGLDAGATETARVAAAAICGATR